MIKNPWHFPRRQLAEDVLMLLNSGSAQALTMFAPRRSGKTQFLMNDLAPLAQSKGHRTVYASFWQAPVAPVAVLLHELEHALRPEKLGERLKSLSTRLKPRLTLSAPDGSAASAEIDLTALEGSPPANLLLHLDDLLGRFADQSQQSAILLLDEVQELARDDVNTSLVAALRTSLDKRSESLKVVFTGSSQEGLKAMFGTREAPFFHFATAIDLPQLGDEFVGHLLRTFQLTAKRKLDEREIHDAFEQLHRNPYYFRRLIDALILNRTVSVGDAVLLIRDQVADELGYSDDWLRLTGIQRATATILANGMDKPFSQASRERIGEILQEKTPSAARVQAAIRKLERMGLADTATGGWSLTDPELTAWIQRHQ